MAESTESICYEAKGYQGKKEGDINLSIDQDKEMKWTVSVLKNKYLSHHTLLFESVTTSNKFTGELLVHKDQVMFRYRNFDPARYTKLNKQHLGECMASAHYIIDTGESVIKHHGDYHASCNNCQVRIRS